MNKDHIYHLVFQYVDFSNTAWKLNFECSIYKSVAVTHNRNSINVDMKSNVTLSEVKAANQ